MAAHIITTHVIRSIYTVISLVTIVGWVHADVSINDYRNRTKEIFRDMPADFGPGLTKDGITGYLVRIRPPVACDNALIQRPPNNKSGMYWIALVVRGKCDFSVKVYNAQRHGYIGVIVYNNDSDSLLHMGGDKRGRDVTIPSVFISRTNGLYIGELYNYRPGLGYTVTMDSEGPLDMNYYLVPFAAVVGCCFLLMLVFMVGKWLRDYRARHKSRVSKKHLKTIPTKKFNKGDEYDLCAICLEDYEEGEKLRELPCAHMYHCKCIDQWLTKSRGTCPVCKRKVFPNLRSDSESETDSEAGNSERTPLLSDSQATTSGHGAIQHTEPLLGAEGGISNLGAEYSSNDAAETQTAVADLSSDDQHTSRGHASNSVGDDAQTRCHDVEISSNKNKSKNAASKGKSPLNERHDGRNTVAVYLESDALDTLDVRQARTINAATDEGETSCDETDTSIRV